MSFKKRTVGNKKPRSKADSDEEDETTVMKPIEQSKAESIGFQSTGGLKKTTEVSSGVGASVTTVFESSRELVPQSYAGDATHTSEVDTAQDRDARAVLERNIALNTKGGVDNEATLYRGQAGYKNFVEKDMAQVGAAKHTGTQGPVRAPTFVRVTSRFDYQPDICKDYKETGFCGYGDSCKFLHDRGDYKSGWQLEREWESQQTKKKKRMEDSIAGFGDEGNEKKTEDVDDDNEDKYAIDSDEEDLPFACFICREDFTNPIVTVCGHYFCGQCAMDTAKSTGNKCPICNRQTFGVFNRAHKLLKKIAAKSIPSEAEKSKSSSSVSVATKLVAPPPNKRGSWESVDS